MAMNACEQRVLDYLEGHAEEKKHWVGKVQKLAASETDPHVAANRLDSELWGYYKERSGIVPAFKEAVRHEGSQRTSMKSLAEYLIRLWVAPKPKPPAQRPAE